MLLAAGIVVFLLGLAVGSFLNVVIYRLPRELSPWRPRRSFCPVCHASIAWYDNLPILSWLLLRGRCRRCAAPISLQYPLVEGASGLCFLLCFYLLFVQQARWGCDAAELPGDLPLLAAFMILSATMLVCAAMDLVSYAVDVRVTWVGMAGGTICYALWPRAAFFSETVSTPLAPAAVACLLVSLVWLWLTFRRSACEPEADAPLEAEPSAPVQGAFAAGAVAIIAMIATSGWLLAGTARSFQSPPASAARITAYPGPAYELAVPAALLVLFVLIVLAGGQHRPADMQVRSAIEREQPRARRQAFGELCWLVAPLAAATVGYVLARWTPGAAELWQRLVTWSPGGGFCPAAGAVYALLGLSAGAAAGWLLRIVFTLIFGREAMGLGDIYILAAAGATGGWDITLLGLLLGVGIALAGYLVSLLLKRTVIIPFGPWLGLGFLCALWLNRPAARIAGEYLEAIRFSWSRRPDMCVLSAGLLLVGAAGAIVLSRLLRRAVENSAG